MRTNYIDLLNTMIEDIERIIEEVEDNYDIREYIASRDGDLEKEINEYNDITMAVIKMATDKYIQIISNNSTVDCTTYAIRRSMRDMVNIIEENNSIKELIMESYGCSPNFGDEVMESLDAGDYEGVIKFMLIEEIINC